MKRRKRKEMEQMRQLKLYARNKMCKKKRAYLSLDEAEGYAKMYSDPRYGGKGDSILRSYFCPQCHKFHLTSQKKIQKTLDIH